jgi:hypothetical protein
MKINRQQKLLFIHIPKCGGASVWRAFDMEISSEGPHIGIELAKKKFPTMTRDYLKFTTIRNPWEAEVSNFFYKLHDSQDARCSEAHLETAVGGFSSMLKEGNTISCFSPDKIKTHKHGRSMMRFITDEDDNIVVDEILRLENLQEDIKKICEKHKVNLVKELKRENKTHHLHYRQYYKEQWMIDCVYENNQDYIEKFNYTF